jgi:hypothetical protein
MRLPCALALLALPLAGCAQPSGPEDCGLVLTARPRAIDEGTRYDVADMRSDPMDVRAVQYRFQNSSSEGRPVVLEGNVGELLASGGNHTLRFLDARNDSLLGPGDAFVLRAAPLLLTLSRGQVILGGSFGCA